MKLYNNLKKHLNKSNLELTQDMAYYIALAIKEYLPSFYERAKKSDCDDLKLVKYTDALDLTEEEIIKILKYAGKIGNLKAFI